MNRKVLAVLLIAISVALVFGGCSADKQPETATSASITDGTNEAVTAEGIELLETTENASEPELEEETTVGVPDISDKNEQEVLSLSEEPSYGFVWALDEEAIKNAGKNPETIEYITRQTDGA